MAHFWHSESAACRMRDRFNAPIWMRASLPRCTNFELYWPLDHRVSTVNREQITRITNGLTLLGRSVSPDTNQIRPTSSWGFHSFPGFLPNLPAHASQEAPVNLATLGGLPQNAALQMPKTAAVAGQNNSSLAGALSHVYPDSRYPNVSQFPFRTTSHVTASSGESVTTTAAGPNLGAPLNPMGVCAPGPLDPAAHSMLATSCQQMNAPLNNSMMNNAGVSNGAFRHQPYVAHAVTPKASLPIAHTTAGGILEPITQVSATAGMSFPMGRPTVMMAAQGTPPRIPIHMGNSESSYASQHGYALPRNDSHHGILNLKQEPVDSAPHNHMPNHVGGHAHGGLDVAHNGATEDVMNDRNGTTTPKGVWRPY